MTWVHEAESDGRDSVLHESRTSRDALTKQRIPKERNSSQEPELDELAKLETELDQFKTDWLEIAAFWKPVGSKN
jgi:hypothetical protein